MFNKKKFDNRCIFFIGDLHYPYEHRDTEAFLKAVKKKYKPTRIVQVGDEVDGHAWSYHDAEPDLDGPGPEFKKAKKKMQNLQDIFKTIQFIESNHGSLHVRKSKTHGIPSGFIKSYQDAWGVSENFTWHFELLIKGPDKKDTYVHHSRGANVLQISQAFGKNVVQGHHHNKQCIQYWTSGYQTYFGAFTGCFVDVDCLSQAYGKNNIKKPLLGGLLMVDGAPRILRMNLKSNGRWDGRC